MITRFAEAALWAVMTTSAAHAQTAVWPSKPVKWIVGYSPGGTTDTMARLIAEPMSQKLGQPIVVENKPGANTNIAAETLSRSAPDGYTIMIADNGTLVNNAALYKKLAYNPVTDLALVSMAGRVLMVLVVNPATGIRDFNELKRKVAAAPQKYRYASGGSGSPFHIGMEAIKQQAGLSITHIPYKGTAPAVQDVVSGHVEMMIAPAAVVLPYIKANKLIAIASANSKRLTQLPEVPTLTEYGLTDADFSGWQAIVVPAQTPDAIKEKLGSALKEALSSASVRQRFSELGIEPMTATPAEMKAYQQAEINRWHKFIRERGISLD